MIPVIYYLDNIPFKEYCVFVSDSTGLYDRPSFKDGLKYEWANEHGFEVDLTNRYIQSNEISIDCFIYANSRFEFLKKYNIFINEIDKPGSRRLSVIADDIRTEYQVFRSDKIETQIHFDEVNCVGVFKIKLIENMPVKRVLKMLNHSTSITISSSKILVINWGDGAQQYTSPTITNYTKTYSNNGIVYYPLILGDIDSISNFETNCEILWSKL